MLRVKEVASKDVVISVPDTFKASSHIAVEVKSKLDGNKGALDPEFNRYLKHVIRTHVPDIVMLMETRGSLLWVLGGDFNAILNLLERLSGSMRHDGVHQKFGDFMQREGLVDLGFQGLCFTWRRGNLYQRLDRVVSNDASYDVWLESYVLQLARLGSDHRPLLLVSSMVEHARRQHFSGVGTWNKDAFGYIGKKKSIFMASIRGIEKATKFTSNRIC
ncbi:hypothetical protein V6N13_008043 [Hibiscus sabdariffa]